MKRHQALLDKLATEAPASVYLFLGEEELLKGLEGLTPPENQPEPEADMGDEEE